MKHKHEKHLERQILAEMDYYHVPGFAMAVVDSEGVLYEKACGVTSVGTGTGSERPVTADTLFAVASCTKSLTSALISILADEGTVDYDVPVKEYVPGFQMADTAASEGLTLRDILCHRSGLGGHDGMWPSELSPEEFLYRLRWLELNQPFRYTAQYSNVMYTAAGYIAAAAAGKPWETLVREKILEPAGMEQSCFSAEMMHRADDYAQGHLWTGKGWKQMPAWEMKGAEPAASWCAGLKDMEKWLRIFLGHGIYQGRRILSEKGIRKMWTLHMPNTFSPWVFPEIPDLGGYGLGWVIRLYRGRKICYHHGEIEGYCSLQAVVPDLGRGIVMMANRHCCCHGFFYTILFSALDQMMDAGGDQDLSFWSRRLRSADEKRGKDGENPVKRETELSEVSGEGMEQCEGIYSNPAYGEIEIRIKEAKLYLYFRDQKVPVLRAKDGSMFASGLKEDTMYLDVKLVFWEAAPNMESQKNVKNMPDTEDRADKIYRKNPGVSVTIEPSVRPVWFEKRIMSEREEKV